MGSRAATIERRRRVEDVLRSGIDTVVQPIVDLDNGVVVGVESLARFGDERGPADWFADAAAAGLGVELEIAAARSAIARLRELPPDAYLTVNVSPEAASSPALADALAATPQGRVVLEITEHAPVRDYDKLTFALSRLRDRGVRIAIDDAGAGFASMAHVLRLRPEVIKLDISLTRGIDSDPQRRALVRALVDFARSTRCTIVAEGIESAEQLATLRSLGVQCGQGFHLGVPGPMPTGWRVPLGRARRVRGHREPLRAGRVGRVLRPAVLMLTAVLAWQGISSVAGLRGPAVGPGANRPAAAAARAGSGGSARSPSHAPQPASTSATRTSGAAPATTGKPTASAKSVVTQTTSPAPAVCGGAATSTLCGAVGGTLGATDHLVDQATQTLGQTLKTVGGLVRGLLGHH